MPEIDTTFLSQPIADMELFERVQNAGLKPFLPGRPISSEASCDFSQLDVPPEDRDRLNQLLLAARGVLRTEWTQSGQVRSGVRSLLRRVT